MSKPPTVYVVTSGCYSDYHIDGVFSSKRFAEKYIQNVHAGDSWRSKEDFNIEEWKLDLELKATKHTAWYTGMLLDDGSVVESSSSELFNIPHNGVTQCGDKVPFYQNRPIVRAVSTKSAEHAHKLAAEARQAWLRDKAGA